MFWNIVEHFGTFWNECSKMVPLSPDDVLSNGGEDVGHRRPPTP
jgi:hypothetical protein